MDDVIRAAIGKNTKLTLTGSNTVSLDETAAGSGHANFLLDATRESQTITKASAFAAGKNTAVGTSVTVNITSSDVQAILSGNVTSEGAAVIRAESSSQDDSDALATALGADMDRYLKKFAKGVSATEDTANKLLAGKYFDEESADDKKETATGEKINKTLEEKGNGKTDPKGNLSSNALRTQDAKAPSGKDAKNADYDFQGAFEREMAAKKHTLRMIYLFRSLTVLIFLAAVGIFVWLIFFSGYFL